MIYFSDGLDGDDGSVDRVRGQSDDGGLMGRRGDTGPDDGMGPNAPDDVAGEDEPIPGLDDDVEDDR